MLLNDEEVQARLVSPLNLINKLKATKAAAIVSIPPQADEIIDGLEDKIKRASLARKAEGLADAAIDELALRLTTVNANRLSSIAKDMSTIVSNIRGDKEDKGNSVQVVVYAPQIISAENFQAIHVNE